MTLSVAMRHQFTGLSLDISFQAPTPAVTAVFGPSGCGKSTLIAAIAGLLRADCCEVSLDGISLSGHPAERRGVGLVFQNPRLFPHMTVAANLRYGQRRHMRSGGKPPEIEFDDVVNLLAIEPLLRRRPATLSGGEQQRVAIGRALLAQPRLLLMDEPLASLDADRKAEILPYLASLKTRLRVPVVYVTHSAAEVVRLADWLVLMQPGRVIAAGSVHDLTARGDVPFGHRDDAGSVLTMVVDAHDPERRLSRLRCQETALLVPLVRTPVGGSLRVRIPAREVILATERPGAISVHNIIEGRVRAVTEDPERHGALVEVAVSDGAILSRVTPDAVRRLGLVPDAPVLALVKSVAVEVLED